MDGDDEAMVRTGHMLMTGYGAQADTHQAAAWLRQAMAIQDYKEPGSGFSVLNLQDSSVPKLNSQVCSDVVTTQPTGESPSVSRLHSAATAGQLATTAVALSHLPLACVSRHALGNIIMLPRRARSPACDPLAPCSAAYDMPDEDCCDRGSVYCDSEDGSEATGSGHGGDTVRYCRPLRRSRSLPHLRPAASMGSSDPAAPRCNGPAGGGASRGGGVTGHQIRSDVRSLSSCCLFVPHSGDGRDASRTDPAEPWTFEA